jgi:hypothetical protein
VVAGYHYTAVSLRRVRAGAFVTVEEALLALEQRLAEEIQELGGVPLVDVDEDTTDEVFGEAGD